jgi:hypothetical protein
MFTITITDLNLTKQQEKYLEKEFTKLEKTTGKTREQLFKEAFIKYILHMEWDIKQEIAKEIWERREKNNKKPRKLEKELEEIEKHIIEKTDEREPDEKLIIDALFGYIQGGY